MSEKKKKTSLLGKVLGKGNKDEDGKKGKKVSKGGSEKHPKLTLCTSKRERWVPVDHLLLLYAQMAELWQPSLEAAIPCHLR